MIVGQSMIKARISTKFLKGQRWHSYLYPVLEGVGVGGLGWGVKNLSMYRVAAVKKKARKKTLWPYRQLNWEKNRSHAQQVQHVRRLVLHLRTAQFFSCHSRMAYHR